MYRYIHVSFTAKQAFFAVVLSAVKLFSGSFLLILVFPWPYNVSNRLSRFLLDVFLLCVFILSTLYYVTVYITVSTCTLYGL